MSERSQELLALIRSIGERPSMYGSPQAAHGQILACAAFVLKEELGGELAPHLPLASALVKESAEEVVEAPSQLVELCDERIVAPGVHVSYQAVTRHTVVFLQLLKGHIEAVRRGETLESGRSETAP